MLCQHRLPDQKKTEKASNDSKPSGPSRYVSDEQLEEYKKTALDNDIIIKNVKTTLMQPAVVDVEIDGKDYKFYTHIDFVHDEYDANSKAAHVMDPSVSRKNSSWHYDADKLPVLIRNIKDQHRGRFVQINNKEVLIPFVADSKPDITKDTTLKNTVTLSFRKNLKG